MKDKGLKNKNSINFEGDTERMAGEFMELVSFDSESLNERQIADRLKEKFEELGCHVEEDDAAEKIGGSCGNLLIRVDGVPADDQEGSAVELNEPVLFSAHMDTVVPGKGKKAVMSEDGRIVGNGEAVLGADDVTGIVEILEGIRMLKESGVPHRPIEVLLTVSEETFGRGITAFDTKKLQAKEGYILDLSGAVGKAAVQAPTLIMFRISVEGRSAHAGFEPENGINAIEAAAKAISKLEQGRIGSDTTFNIGRIKGGRVTNIVSDECVVTGEVRSYDNDKAERIIAATEEVFQKEAEAAGARVTAKSTVLIRAYRVEKDSRVCTRFRKALKAIGLDDREETCLISTFGGSDNNVLVARGIEGIVLSSGMYGAHSLEEYTTVEDLVKGARLVATLCTM